MALKASTMIIKFAAYAPNFQGPVRSEESFRVTTNVAGNANVDRGDGGAFVNHCGDRQWL